MKILKKLSLVTAAALILTSAYIPAWVQAAISLPSYFYDVTEPVGERMPFKPIDKYGSMQNPPDFTWPQVAGAVSYDLRVLDENDNVKYSKDNLKNSYYNFSEAFEPGTYFWQVRCSNGTEYSDWSAKRRFRVDPDTSVFEVPSVEEIAAKVPVSHPRIYMTAETIDDFKSLANTASGSKVLERMIDTTEQYIAELESTPNKSFSEIELLEDPEISEASAVSAGINARARIPALTYIFTGNEEYKDYAIKALLHMCTYDYNDPNKGTSFVGQDQGFFEILLGGSMVYDWLYNDMTAEQINTVQTMLKGRFDVVKDYSLNSLRRSPYNSHIWSYFGYYGTACIALMHDVDGMDYYFKEMLPLFLANVPPMSTEDGGWSKGLAYWTYAFSRDKWFMDILAMGDYINVYNKAWAQNEYLWQLYMYPANSYGSFGDESNFTKPGTLHIIGLAKLAKFTDNPVAAWAKNEIGSVSDTAGLQFDSILFADTDEMQEKAPVDYPKAHVFIDQGMTAMHSSLTSQDRISLYFRSGRYGSYNHMHADQNSFMIEAFGERLAIKSGFYDSYHSPGHDTPFTRATYTHNSITYNNGQGQLDDSMDANGNTEMFVTTNDFDAVVGNATKAYNGGLNKFIRSIIYIRPDVYVVIDDLEAKTGETASFEWALNAPSNTMTVKNDSEAVISSGQAVLETKIQYPQDTESVFMHNYEDLNGNSYPPGYNYTGREPQDRVYFKTPQSDSAKIIATMNVHKLNDSSKSASKTETDSYVALSFEDGSTVVINKGSDTSSVTAGSVTFTGKAVAYNNDSIMLLGGTSLYFEGEKVFEADREITAIVGRGELSVSSDDDYEISLGLRSKYVSSNFTKDAIKELSVSKMKKRSLSPAIGIDASDGDGEIIFTADKGHYKLLLDDNAVVSTDELIPANLYALKDESGNVTITWDYSSKIDSVDLKINNSVYENVSSPFYLTGYKDDTITLSARGKQGSLTSDWSDSVNFYFDAKEDTSYTELKMTDAGGSPVVTPEKDGYARAAVSIRNFSGANNKLVLAQYDIDGTLVDVAMQDISIYLDAEATIMSPMMKVRETSNIIKAFIFNMDNLEPLARSASSEALLPQLKGITLDDVPLEGFSPDVTDYTVSLDVKGLVPVVKGIADNAIYVTTSYEADEVTGGATVRINVETRDGKTAVYTVNFARTLLNATLPISDFTFIHEGKTLSEYCSSLGIEHDLTQASNARIPNYYKLLSFSIGGDLCGTNQQRKITAVNKRLDLENTLFLAPDPALCQDLSSDPWIVSAFFSRTYTVTDNAADYGKTIDFGDYCVPWFSVKINKDCEAVILSANRIPKYDRDSSWRYVKLTEEPYHAYRYINEGHPYNGEVSGYYNMYVRKCYAGETLQLYNENSENVSAIPYLTFFRF